LTLDPTQPDPPKTENFVTRPNPTRRVDGPDPCPTLISRLDRTIDVWAELDVDGLERLYNDEITVLDHFIPVRTVRCRRRPSNPWFDEECREAKRHTRRLERAALHTTYTNAAVAATALWTTQSRAYRDLLCRKRESFWKAKVDAERSTPRQLWHSIDALLGRGRVPPLYEIGATEFHRFFRGQGRWCASFYR